MDEQTTTALTRDDVKRAFTHTIAAMRDLGSNDAERGRAMRLHGRAVGRYMGGWIPAFLLKFPLSVYEALMIDIAKMHVDGTFEDVYAALERGEIGGEVRK
jgi:hypothetical protein